jgi:hypothetical protein
MKQNSILQKIKQSPASDVDSEGNLEPFNYSLFIHAAKMNKKIPQRHKDDFILCVFVGEEINTS